MTNKPKRRFDPLSAWLCLVAATAVLASPRFDCSNAFGDMGRTVCGGAGVAILERALPDYPGTAGRYAGHGDHEAVGEPARHGRTRILDENPRTAAMHDCEATAKCSCMEGTEDR
jgi:hypothetical protein